MNTNCSIPASRASSTAYWMTGLSTTGSISLGMALVAGKNRVPIPATGNTALRTGRGAVMLFPGDVFGNGLFHGMGPPLLSSFKDLAGMMGKSPWMGILAVAMMAGMCWAMPATAALIAEVQEALERG